MQNAIVEAEKTVPDTACVEEQADIEFVLYKVADLVKEMSKSVEKARKRRVYLMCIFFASTGREEPIRTDYVTSTPKVTYIPRLPSATNAEQRSEFQELLRYFGVNEEAIVGDLLRPHWPSYLDFVEKCNEKGVALPPGVLPERFPVYDVIHRSTKRPLND